MNISTVHRFLTSLLATGYAVQEEESGLYRLTFGFCRLGDSIRANTELHSLCLPYLRQIAQQTGWTALLVREYDMTALCAEAVPGERAGGALPRRDMAPLQASASGRLLLTGWNARRLEQLAQMRGLRGGGPSTLAALRRELVMVRARGYALDNEETEPGWRGLAVPLRDYTNQPVAALEVRGPVRAWPGDEALEPLEALVQSDGLGRMKVTATLSRTPFEEEELQGLAEEVEHLCRRSFGLPQVNHCRTVTTLIFAEKPVYEAVFGLALRPARQEASGDAARQFCDGSGRAHMLLCDGMGVGKYAAVDGAMAANLADRLLRTGFEGDTTARLVNVALNLKSEEESGAALDLLSVDLYTGRVRLYKAGAAPSFTVQQGKVRAVEGAGLPVGILKEVSGKEHRFGMTGGDWVVLVSDGVLGEGDTWLRQQIELCAAVGNTPQEMADILADTARRRQSGTAPADDITVEVLKLERSL